ncbi:MAG TPA: hypothetical protein VF037_10025 [Gemmatimonadales bacterium]
MEPRLWPLVPGLLALAACTEAGARQTATITDSAGITIVESREPAWRDGEAYVLDSVPALRIGGNEQAEPAYDLLRVADAIRLSDGSIALINGGTSDVRIYSADGHHLRTVGRAGEGPGEFRAMEVLDRTPGDTLFVYDYLLRRLTTVAPDGTLLETRPLLAGTEVGFVQPLVRLSDGSWAATSQVFSGDAGEGARRDTLSVIRIAPGLDSIADSIGAFPASEMFISRGGEGSGRFITFSLIPFGLTTRINAGRDRIYVGNPERYLIEVYRPDGTLERSIRRPVERAPVTEEDVARLRESELEGGEADPRFQRQIEQKWESAPVPALKPAYGRLTVDRDGFLWVEVPRVLDEDPGAADVFDPEGRLLGRIPLPPSFRITEIGRDYVLGVAEDADTGLEQVRLYLLHRPERSDG